MPHHDPDHRFARAAGKATRSFLDGQRQDAEAEARNQRQAQQRRQARAAVGGSVLLRTACWWWGVVTVVFALLTVSFIVAGASMPATDTGALLGVGRTEQYVLAAVTGVLTLATGTGAVQLMRGRRSAVGLLTAIAVMAGIPLIVRGHPLLITFAVVLLAGAALVWLPPVRRRLRAS